jgi:hypothetical protein
VAHITRSSKSTSLVHTNLASPKAPKTSNNSGAPAKEPPSETSSRASKQRTTTSSTEPAASSDHYIASRDKQDKAKKSEVRFETPRPVLASTAKERAHRLGPSVGAEKTRPILRTPAVHFGAKVTTSCENRSPELCYTRQQKKRVRFNDNVDIEGGGRRSLQAKEDYLDQIMLAREMMRRCR